MWGPWRLGVRRRPPLAACHFCGSESVIVPPYGTESALRKVVQRSDASAHPLSSGTRTRWFCSVCQSWNHQDEQGHVLDLYERPMWDADMNRTAFATRSTPAPTSSVFCRSCLANQTIVANLLANYLADDADEASDNERMAAYPAYRRSLEERYPLVCAQCAPQVQAHLAQSDQRVRSEALRYWMKRHAAVTLHDSRDGAVPVRHHGRAVGAALVLGAGTIVPLCLCASLPLHLCMTCAAVACLPTWWDARASHKDRLDARAVRYVARGARAWQGAQISLWLIRLSTVYAWHAKVSLPVIGALGVLHTLLCLAALYAYRLEPQAPLHLASRVAVASPPQDPASNGLAALSLADEPRVSAPLDTLWQETEVPEAMDIDPEPIQPRPFSLAPPRFGGPMSSGLEDLFGQALRLDAMPHTSSAPWARGLPWLVGAMAVGIGAMVMGYDLSTWAGRWGQS